MLLALVLLVVSAGSARLIAATTATTAPADPLLQQAIDQLGAEEQSTRDTAEANLIARGKSACDLLSAAAADSRPDVRARARRALRTIHLFLLPGVPDKALSIARAYLNANDFDHRKPQLNRLFQMQPQPDAVLTRLVVLEQDEDLRRQMLYQISIGYRPAVPRMLVDDDDLPGVLALLSGSAEMWGRGEAADDAVALQLSGQIDQQIAICTAEQINGDTVARERAATQLCYLYRICGKSDQALKYARLARDPSLVFLVLQDRGDWSAAVTEPDDRWRDPLVSGAYRAAFQRLAGHPQAALDIMSAFSVAAPNDPDASFSPSRLFLLNDLPQRGIELLTDQHPAVAFQMRLARGEISQAIEIAEKYQNHPRDQAELSQSHDALLQSLGELPEPTTAPAPPAEVNTGPAARAWQEAVEDLNQKKYQAAADAFAGMWAIDRTHFDRLYLQGYCLVQAGQIDRGRELMQKAEILPLGDPLARWLFASQLEAAGLSDVAEQQRQLGLRSGGDFDEVGFSEIYNTRMENAIERKRWSAASDALDRLCLINLSAQVQWHDPVRLLSIPAMAHLAKAREARERGDLPTTMRELQIYQQYLPVSSDMVLEMVPALDDLGEHANADELFNGVYDKLSAICRKYPRSVTYLNELAWLCACCDRRLDEGLDAATSAVRLRPDDWQVLDTLAEVRFRRGDRAAAIDIEKRAMSMTSNEYIARQVKRFETATVPSTTQPGVAPE